MQAIEGVPRATEGAATRLSHTVGLLINFNVKLVVKEGLSRIVNGFPDGSE